MNVEGYLTSTRNADVDLSAVDLTVKKATANLILSERTVHW